MSYHCPRCGFYYCENFGASLSFALEQWPAQVLGQTPATPTMKDDPDTYPF